MAIFGNETVIVSLGVSCQTAMQLEVHETEIMRRLGGGERHATPLDWVLAPVASTAAMLDEWRFLPGDDDFEMVPAPYWPAMRTLLLHESGWLDDRARCRARGEHKARTLRSVADKQRKVFIVSNTQNNLTLFDNRLGVGWYRFSGADIATLRRSLERRFGLVELYVVSYADRHEVVEGADVVFNLTPDATPVRGDGEQWGRVLKSIV